MAFSLAHQSGILLPQYWIGPQSGFGCIEQCFPQSRRQRCLVHKLRNIAGKLSLEAQEEIMPKIKNALYQTDIKIAKICLENIIDEYADEYPSAMRCLEHDLDACLSFMEFPAGHHKHIRTRTC